MIINFDSKKKIDEKDQLIIGSIIQDAFWEKMKWYFSKVSKEEATLLIAKAITYNIGYYYKDNDEILGAALLSKSGVPHLNIGKGIRKKIGFWKAFLLKTLFTMSPRNEETLCLQMIAVNPIARGKGIGKKMLDYLDDFTRKEGFKQVVLDVIDNNEGAIKLYKREGYFVTKHMKTKLFTHGMGFDGIFIMKKTY